MNNPESTGRVEIDVEIDWDEVQNTAERLQILLVHTMEILRRGLGGARTCEIARNMLDTIISLEVDALYRGSTSQLRKQN